MKQLSGIYFTDHAADVIADHKANGETVTLLRIGDDGGCTNCQSDTGMMGIFATDRGEHPIVNCFSNKSGHNYYFHCPICNDDSQERQTYLWELSGLQFNERDWHVDFIADMAGKENALKLGRELLATTPTPTGWHSVSGAYGVGKSGLLKSLVAGFIRAGVEARYLRAEDILSEIRATFNGDGGDNESEVIRKYSRVKVLAVDEVGTDRMSSTQWAQAKLMSIFDNRYSLRDKVATIFATNETPESLSELFGYLASRMKDGRRALMNGADLRGGR